MRQNRQTLFGPTPYSNCRKVAVATLLLKSSVNNPGQRQ